MRRREFIGLVGGAAALPLVGNAQEASRMRRIGLLTGVRADDPGFKSIYAAFEQALQQLGWTKDRNVRIDYRFGGGDPANIRRQAEELVALSPDVIVAALRRDRCFGPPTPCRSCLRSCPIQSAPASSIVWRSRAAMPPASCSSNMA